MGAALAGVSGERGDEVYALGRQDNKCLLNQPRYCFLPVDLSDLAFIKENISDFVKDHCFDLVILNADILGEINRFYTGRESSN